MELINISTRIYKRNIEIESSEEESSDELNNDVSDFNETLWNMIKTSNYKL